MAIKSHFSHLTSQTVNCTCQGKCNCGTKPLAVKDQFRRGLGTSANLEILGDDFSEYLGD